MPDQDEPAGATHEHLINEGTESELETNIRLLFDRSVSNVQTYSSKMQQDYLNPAYGHAKAFSEVYPVLSLFIGFYSALGFVPILLFLCSSIFVISASIAVVLTLAVIFAVSVVGLFAVLLFCALFCTSLISVVATLFVLFVYQLTRLVTLVREQPTLQAGVKTWASELREFALARLPEDKVRAQRIEDSPVKVEMHDIDLH